MGYCVSDGYWKNSSCSSGVQFASRRSGKAGGSMDTKGEYGTKIFMDVGAWQLVGDREAGNPATMFGIVCEQDVILCDWLNRAYKGRHDSPFGDVPSPLKAFLSHCEGIKRGGAVSWVRASEPLTAKGRMLLVLPDMHINLLKGDQIDFFQYRPVPGVKYRSEMGKWTMHKVPDGWKSELVSLDEELYGLIASANRVDANIIQVGDLYEVWEAEMMLRLLYHRMLQYGLKSVKDKYGWPIGNVVSSDRSYYGEYLYKAMPDNAIKWMIKSGRVAPCLPNESADEYVSRMAMNSASSVQSVAIDFRSTDAICLAIEKAYPKIFRAGAIDVGIRGNHDNFLANDYWTRGAIAKWFEGINDLIEDGFQCRLHDVEGHLCSGTSQSKRSKVTEWLGDAGDGKIKVWIEHGHYYDWHNSNDRWSSLHRGFDTVFRGTGKTQFTDRGFIQFKRHSWWLANTALWLGGVVPDAGDYEMRLPEVRRCDAIFGDPYHFDRARTCEFVDPRDYDPLPSVSKKERPQLVIMGHTHGPALIEITRHMSMRGLGTVIKGSKGRGWTGYTARGWMKELDGQFLHEPCGAQFGKVDAGVSEGARLEIAKRVSPIGREEVF